MIGKQPAISGIPLTQLTYSDVEVTTMRNKMLADQKRIPTNGLKFDLRCETVVTAHSFLSPEKVAYESISDCSI